LYKKKFVFANIAVIFKKKDFIKMDCVNLEGRRRKITWCWI